MIKAWLEARIWQVGTIGTAVVALGLTMALGLAHHDLKGVRKDLKAERAAHQLTAKREWTAQGNVTALSAGIEAQNAQIRSWKADSDARLAKAGQAVTSAQRATLSAEIASAWVKSHPPVGTDVCVRVQDSYETFVKAIQ